MKKINQKDFEEIAKIINNHIEHEPTGTSFTLLLLNPKGLIDDLSNYFKTQNPDFDENQFKKACLK